MYTFSDFGALQNDPVRTPAYLAALKAAIKPSSVVLDLGCGPGFFAFAAIRMGARHAYGIEIDDSVFLAKAIADANPTFSERATFIHGDSTEVQLPEPVDIIISDLHGVLPLYGRNLPSIADARDRFLRPGGVLIPLRERVWAAPVSATEVYDRHFRGWDREWTDLDISAGRRAMTSEPSKNYLSPEDLVGAPQCFADLEYARVNGPDQRANLTWELTKPCDVHGVLLWFDSDLGFGQRFNCGPGNPRIIFGQMFAPFETPIAAEGGTRLEVNISFLLAGDFYLVTWNAELFRGGTSIASRQQTSANLIHEGRDHASPFAVYNATTKAEIHGFILSQIDGRRTIAEIAVEVCRRWPESFPVKAAAVAVIAKLVQRYSLPLA